MRRARVAGWVRHWVVVALAVMLVAAVGPVAAAESRVALVIGNADYKDAPLKNPVNDARDVAAKLRGLGFDVILRENATKQQLEEAIGAFGERLKDGAVAMIFYSGHGLQVQGRNFLIPVDAKVASEAQVRLQTVDVDVVLDQMAAAHSRVNLVILDACRNNPFEHRFRGLSGGLAQMNAPEGTMIAYATAPGKVASDGESRNGLYTEEFLKAIDQPGIPIEDVFKHVRTAVMQRSDGAQTPWESSSLTGDFYFKGGSSAETPARTRQAGATELDKEALFWESIKDSTNPAAFKAYLDQYPKGTFAELASVRAAELTKTNKPPQSARSPGSDPATAPPPTQGSQPPVGQMASLPPGLAEEPAPGSPEGFAFRLERLRARAEAGGPKAQLMLGRAYENGLGVPKNVPEAVVWYRRAADSGDVGGMVALGNMLRAGRGVPRDDAQALTLFRKAAALNHPGGQAALGFMLLKGTDGVVTPNPGEAIRLFGLAAGQRNPHGQFGMGLALETGAGVKQDFAAAVKWYRAAADQGLGEACVALGRAFESGHGVVRNQDEAVRWYRLAAAKGNVHAQERLAKLNGGE